MHHICVIAGVLNETFFLQFVGHSSNWDRRTGPRCSVNESATEELLDFNREARGEEV